MIAILILNPPTLFFMLLIIGLKPPGSNRYKERIQQCGYACVAVLYLRCERDNHSPCKL